MTPVLFLSFFILGFSTESTAINYCQFSRHHVLCGGQRFDKRCGDGSQVQMHIVTEAEREEILNAHNEFRNIVSMGSEPAFMSKSTKEYFHPSSNMEELVWDNELESVAQGYARTCKQKVRCKECIRVGRFDVVEENTHLQEIATPQSWENVINDWTYEEAKKFDINYIYHFSVEKNKHGFGMKHTRNLVQVLWAKTTQVGCSRVSFMNQTLSVCLYGPGGRIEKAPIYKVGQHCTECVRECSIMYSFLCSRINRIEITTGPSLATTISTELIPAGYCLFSMKHVLCGGEVFDKRCGDVSQVQMHVVTGKEVDEILHAHNEFRNIVSNGTTFEMGNGKEHFPSASNMQELVWDNELESVAQGYARTCKQKVRCKECIRVDRFENVGENTHLQDGGPPQSWKDVIKIWTYEESKIFDLKYIKHFRFGRKCSLCPDDQICSSKYPSLCGQPKTSSTMAETSLSTISPTSTSTTSTSTTPKSVSGSTTAATLEEANAIFTALVVLAFV